MTLIEQLMWALYPADRDRAADLAAEIAEFGARASGEIQESAIPPSLEVAKTIVEHLVGFERAEQVLHEFNELTTKALGMGVEEYLTKALAEVSG